MTYIILDLEWNGAFSKKAHGYFNEIIEIGAVKLDRHMRPIGKFGAMIRPVVSRKLNGWVADLTNITGEELQKGTTFERAFEALQCFIGQEPAAVLTWSNTDLLVLLENFKFFKNEQRIAFMAAYADVQRYFQIQLKIGTAQQVALTKACEMLGIADDDVAAHRAPDDCILTARVLQKVYTRRSFKPALQKADDAFYGRLNFRPSTLCDLKDERIDPKELRFRCPVCHRILLQKKEWQLRGYAFFAPMHCKKCDMAYLARVQVKTTYDGVSVKRKLTVESKKTEDENNGKRKMESGV